MQNKTQQNINSLNELINSLTEVLNFHDNEIKKMSDDKKFKDGAKFLKEYLSAFATRRKITRELNALHKEIEIIRKAIAKEEKKEDKVNLLENDIEKELVNFNVKPKKLNFKSSIGGNFINLEYKIKELISKKNNVLPLLNMIPVKSNYEY